MKLVERLLQWIDCRPGCGPPRCECESRNGYVRARDGACIHVSECATYRGFGAITDPRQPLSSSVPAASPPAPSIARPPAPSAPLPPAAPSPFGEEAESPLGAGAPSGGGGLIPPPSGSAGGEQEATQTGLHTAAVISSPSSPGEVNPQALLSSATVGPNGPRPSGLPTVLPPAGGAAASTASAGAQQGPSPPGAPAIFHPAANNAAPAAPAPAPAQAYSFAYARPPATANDAALYQTSFRIYRHR
ncbi:hypothetical protein AAVH_09295 [Aphelenchoides avenae]|nr:hypothetical protein AAVH_09295 [Aphelenchus avenae]